jgi:hypothetical protein
MLKTMLTIAALMLAQVVQLSAAHAGGGYPVETTTVKRRSIRSLAIPDCQHITASRT